MSIATHGRLLSLDKYCNTWMGPDKYVDKFAVTLMNKDRVVKHLMKGKT